MTSQLSLTLIGKKISNEALEALQLLAKQCAISLNNSTTLSDGKKLGLEALSFDFESCDQAQKIKGACRLYSQKWHIDTVFQEQNKEPIKLACFDMDSTLIQAEVIDVLAAHAGVGEQVAEITEQAMQGKLDFKQSFTKRMSLLKGLDTKVIPEIIKDIPIMDGAARLFKNLAKHQIPSAILSGGFEIFANDLQQRFKIENVVANTLQADGGKLTGVAMPPIIDAERKRIALLNLCKNYGLRENQSMAVGDGANDLKMINTAGLGVAFKAKPIVQEKASAALNHNGLDALLFLMGFKEHQIDV